jgi:hypothetical protein
VSYSSLQWCQGFWHQRIWSEVCCCGRDPSWVPEPVKVIFGLMMLASVLLEAQGRDLPLVLWLKCRGSCSLTLVSLILKLQDG